MDHAIKRTPTWLLVGMVALLALAISIGTGALDAGAKKKKKKPPASQTVERTVVMTPTGSCTAGNNVCTGGFTVTATCPAGTTVTGGGVRLGDPDNEFVEGSYPVGNKGWTAVGFRGNNKTGNSTLTAIAVCRR